MVNELNGEIEPKNIQVYRTQGYLLRIILDIFEYQKSIQIEARLDALEKKIDEKL